MGEGWRGEGVEKNLIKEARKGKKNKTQKKHEGQKKHKKKA